MSTIYRWALVFSLFLFVFGTSGCAAYSPVVQSSEPAMGQLYELGHGATALHVLKLLAGVPNGFVMHLEGSSQYMFFWPLANGRGTAFWGFDVKNAVQMMQRGEILNILGSQSGQVANCVEGACVVDLLKGEGWKVVDTAALAGVRNTIIDFVTYTASKVPMPTFVLMAPGISGNVLDSIYPEPIQE